MLPLVFIYWLPTRILGSSVKILSLLVTSISLAVALMQASSIAPCNLSFLSFTALPFIVLGQLAVCVSA